MKKILGIFSVILASLYVMAACGQAQPTADPSAQSQQEGSQQANATTSDTPTLDAIRERGYLIVGTFGDRPPFGYVDAAGDIVGLDPYISRRFAYEFFGDYDAIEFVITEAANRIAFLQAGHVDLIMATFTITEDRMEQVHFALPYMRAALGVIAPEGSDIQSITDLYGRNLIVTSGTTAEIYFTQNHPQINLVRFGQNTESFAALADGRGDAMSHDNSLLFAHVFANPGFDIIYGSLGEEDYLAPAVNLAATDLLQWLNDTITTLRAENFFYHAYDVTLRDSFTPDTNPSYIMVN